MAGLVQQFVWLQHSIFDVLQIALRFTLFPHESAAVMCSPQVQSQTQKTWKRHIVLTLGYEHHFAITFSSLRQRGIELGIICSCFLVRRQRCNALRWVAFSRDFVASRYFIAGYLFGSTGDLRSTGRERESLREFVKQFVRRLSCNCAGPHRHCPAPPLFGENCLCNPEVPHLKSPSLQSSNIFESFILHFSLPAGPIFGFGPDGSLFRSGVRKRFKDIPSLVWRGQISTDSTDGHSETSRRVWKPLR